MTYSYIDSCQSWWLNKTIREFVYRATKEYNTLKQLGALPNDYQIKQGQKQGETNPKPSEKPDKIRSNQQANRNNRNPAQPNPQQKQAHLQPKALEIQSELMADRSGRKLYLRKLSKKLR